LTEGPRWAPGWQPSSRPPSIELSIATGGGEPATGRQVQFSDGDRLHVRNCDTSFSTEADDPHAVAELLLPNPLQIARSLSMAIGRATPVMQMHRDDAFQGSCG
jgi:hypothetical protein